MIGPKYLFHLSLSLCLLSCERPIFVEEPPPQNTIVRSYKTEELIVMPADILWVVDNSASMDSYQQSLINNMDIFINSFTKKAQFVDWRMGLISTSHPDYNDGEIPYIGFTPSDRIDYTAADPVGLFNQAIASLNISGDNTERAFVPIRHTFKLYPNFLRKGSKLFIIIVSDEPEQSEESVDNFLTYLTILRPFSFIATYGIFTKAEENCGEVTFKGSRYGYFMEFTQGLSFDICSEDYGLALSAFGEDIRKKISSTKFYLDEVPVSGTLQVFYNGRPVLGGTFAQGGFWRYNIAENAIFLHDLSFIQEDDTEKSIKVTFEKMPLF